MNTPAAPENPLEGMYTRLLAQYDKVSREALSASAAWADCRAWRELAMELYSELDSCDGVDHDLRARFAKLIEVYRRNRKQYEDPLRNSAAPACEQPASSAPVPAVRE